MLTNYIDTPDDVGGLLYDERGNCIRVWWRNTLDRRFWSVTRDLRSHVLDDFGTLVPVAP